MPSESWLSGRVLPGADQKCQRKQHEFKGSWTKTDAWKGLIEFRLCRRECGMSEVRWK